jgi:hypothetical protein
MLRSRKIQLAAAAVVLNGLVALTAMSPDVAQANPCSPVFTCAPMGSCGSLALCNVIAPSGCTATGFQCVGGSGCPNLLNRVECLYN